MKINGAGVWLRGISGAAMVFLYLPILVLVVFSFNDSRLSAVWQGFSWHWYAVLRHDDALLAAAVNSLWVAALSTSLAVLLGVPTAMGLERLRGKGARVVETIFLLPLVLPEVMMGVALLLLPRLPPVDSAPTAATAAAAAPRRGRASRSPSAFASPSSASASRTPTRSATSSRR